MRVARLCGCGRVVSGKCNVCSKQRKASTEDYRPNSTERYGSKWTEISTRYRLKNPLCECCREQGRTEAAIEVHHRQKVSDRPDLVYFWGNLMSVCRACHIKLDKAEK
jgi:5-methylcytosine-specific restriction protein A